MLLAEYIAYWEELTPASIDTLGRVAVDDFFFKDPFNEFHSAIELKALLTKMFAKMESPRLHVTGQAVNGNEAYLRWIFTAEGWHIVGMSELKFGADGRAVSHVDHWDAASQVYEKVPVLGGILRLLKRLA